MNRISRLPINSSTYRRKYGALQYRPVGSPAEQRRVWVRSADGRKTLRLTMKVRLQMFLRSKS